MQLLIDTDSIDTAELGATVVYLDDLLRIRRKSDGPQSIAENTAAPVKFTDVVVPFVAPTPTGFATPLPQFPGSSDDVVGDDDPEIEFDTAGNVTAVTVSAELPPAPPVPATWPVGYDTSLVVHTPPPVPVPPGPAVPAELDSRGMPWDARIHAANRSKTIKQEWKAKRGVEAATVAACEAQNKPGNASSVATAPDVSTANTITPAMTAMQAETAMFGHMAPPPPTAVTSLSTAGVPASPVPAPPAPPPPPPVPGASTAVSTTSTAAAIIAPAATIDFRGLMQKIQAASAAGKLTPDQVNAALAGVGLKPEEMAQLINNAPLIASVNAAVDKCLAS